MTKVRDAFGDYANMSKKGPQFVKPTLYNCATSSILVLYVARLLR
jgi:hypothetical protein